MFLSVLISLAGCHSGQNRSTDDYIGKTSAQIEAAYVAFDCCGMPVSEDGLYRSTACGYTVKEQKKTLLGTSPELLVFILFDENGIACDTYEGYRPGG